jgi:hypothetical protein
VSVLRHPPVLGALLGVAVALLFVGVVTAIAGRTEIWWWPAVAVAGIIGGGVLGSVLGAEAEGEPPDEAYEGDRTS